ncbi:hypothetical protein Tco_0083321, partial [Tanacetum coccineum]
MLPPPSGQVIRTYSDADTMLQFMRTWDNLVFLFHMAGGNPAPGALCGRVHAAVLWRFCQVQVAVAQE